MKREARSRVRRRPSGWYSWDICDNLGCKLTDPAMTCEGFEKAKWRAERMAGEAAKLWNERHQPAVEPSRPRQNPVCSKAGEDCEVFSRR